MNTLAKLAVLFAAGGCGTLSRYGLTTLVARFAPSPSTLATTTVNVLGCLCFGLIAETFRISGWPPTLRLIILTGFFGAFTTFSTYMYEIETLASGGSAGKALASFVIQNGLGFAAILIGITAARTIWVK